MYHTSTDYSVRFVFGSTYVCVAFDDTIFVCNCGQLAFFVSLLFLYSMQTLMLSVFLSLILSVSVCCCFLLSSKRESQRLINFKIFLGCVPRIRVMRFYSFQLKFKSKQHYFDLLYGRLLSDISRKIYLSTFEVIFVFNFIAFTHCCIPVHCKMPLLDRLQMNE